MDLCLKRLLLCCVPSIVNSIDDRSAANTVTYQLMACVLFGLPHAC